MSVGLFPKNRISLRREIRVRPEAQLGSGEAHRPVQIFGRRAVAVMTGDSPDVESAMRADIYPLQTLLLTVSGCALSAAARCSSGPARRGRTRTPRPSTASSATSSRSASYSSASPKRATWPSASVGTTTPTGRTARWATGPPRSSQRAAVPPAPLRSASGSAARGAQRP